MFASNFSEEGRRRKGRKLTEGLVEHPLVDHFSEVFDMMRRGGYPRSQVALEEGVYTVVGTELGPLELADATRAKHHVQTGGKGGGFEPLAFFVRNCRRVIREPSADGVKGPPVVVSMGGGDILGVNGDYISGPDFFHCIEGSGDNRHAFLIGSLLLSRAKHRREGLLKRSLSR